MHIEFKKIILHNFMSFGDAELQFNDDGFIRVSGINENPLDNAGSNGSGKSSLWEAIVWAITGDTIRGTKHIVNIYGDDGCFVDIEFYIDYKQYHLIRSKDHKVHKTNLQIFIDGQDVSGKGIRDSEKLLQQYLPDITASLLGSVIILGQGLPQKFTNNTPSGRKEVLEKLSKSDFMIEDLKTRVSKRKTELSQELRSYEDNILELTAQKNVLDSQVKHSETILMHLNSEELHTERQEHQKVQEELVTTLAELHLQRNTLNTTIKEVCEQHSRISAEQTFELSEAKKAYDDLRESPLSSYNELKAQLSVYTKELSRIRAIQDVCPTCGQKITDVHKPDTTSIEQEIDALSAQLDELTTTLNKYREDYESSIKRIEDKYRAVKEQLTLSETSSSSELRKLDSTIQDAELKLYRVETSLSEIDNQIAQLQNSITLHNEIIRENNEKLKVIDEDILYNIKQKELAQSRLEVISKFDTALKRDFRGYLLSTVISFIEQRAKYYSKIIFDTTDISFCLEGNNIDISYMNRAYENLSGGEKQKIDLIIQFSIRDMLSKQLGFTSNILVLDEVFDGLDFKGCTKVIDMIASVSDIKNIFIVTHRKDLSIPSDKELIVAKSSVGISELRQ